MTGLCVVVVEVIAPIRPNLAAGSVRITPRSSIACARSSRTRRLRASVEVAQSVPRPAADLGVTSRVFRPPRTVMRARPRGTSKKPRSTDAAGGDRHTTHRSGGANPTWSPRRPAPAAPTRPPTPESSPPESRGQSLARRRMWRRPPWWRVRSERERHAGHQLRALRPGRHRYRERSADVRLAATLPHERIRRLSVSRYSGTHTRLIRIKARHLPRNAHITVRCRTRPAPRADRDAHPRGRQAGHQAALKRPPPRAYAGGRTATPARAMCSLTSATVCWS